MQRLREEKENAEIELFEAYTAKQRELHRKLEEDKQREEMLLQGKYAEELRSIHRSFGDRERQTQLQLTQKCLTSPTRGKSTSQRVYLTKLLNLGLPEDSELCCLRVEF